MAKYKAPRGQPREFRSGEHLVKCIGEFCEDIIETGYPVLPSKTEFCRWYVRQYKRKICTRTVWVSMAVYYPEVAADIKEMLGDVLAQGAALGKWNATITIFVLKNWCSWSDKREPDEAAAVDGINARLKTLAELTGEEAE